MKDGRRPATSCTTKAAATTSVAALGLVLAGCSSLPALPFGPAASPTPTVSDTVPTYAPFTPSANPTQIAAGAYDKPSTGGVRYAPLANGPLTGKVIALDPGHSGKYNTAMLYDKLVDYYGAGARPCQNAGTTALDKKTVEAALTWDVASKAVDILRNQGATVVVSRPDNNGYGPCNDERAKIANANNADLLISIHADGNLNKTNRGFFVEWSGRMLGGQAVQNASQKAASDVITQVSRHTTIPIASYMGAGGIQQQDGQLGVLNTMKTGPAVLFEMGNVLNAEDWAIIQTDAGRQSIADGLAAAAADIAARGKPTASPSPTATK